MKWIGVWVAVFLASLVVFVAIPRPALLWVVNSLDVSGGGIGRVKNRTSSPVELVSEGGDSVANRRTTGTFQEDSAGRARVIVQPPTRAPGTSEPREPRERRRSRTAGGHAQGRTGPDARAADGRGVFRQGERSPRLPRAIPARESQAVAGVPQPIVRVSCPPSRPILSLPRPRGLRPDECVLVPDADPRLHRLLAGTRDLTHRRGARLPVRPRAHRPRQPDRVEERHPVRRDQDRPRQAQNPGSLGCISARIWPKRPERAYKGVSKSVGSSSDGSLDPGRDAWAS